MPRSLTLIAALVVTGLSLVAQADWKADMQAKAKAAAAQTAQEQLGLALTAPADARVYFINLKNGDTVKSPVLVQFGLKGMGIAPAGMKAEGTGHHHLLLNDPQVNLGQSLPATEQVMHFGKGQTETTLELKPGKHTLQLVLGDYKHQPFNPNVSSEKITITVK